MTKHSLLATGVLAFILPGIGQAVELIGKNLELYGKAHVSLDYSDPDAAGEDSQLSLSNNSTRIGFKGQHAINQETTLLWQYEQGVDIAEAGGEFASRNSFLGIKGRFGQVLAGHYDTPSKSLGSRWGMFSDTIGDRRAILGAYSGYGNVLNDRADNAILYSNRLNELEIDVMYSTDPSSDDVSGGLDNNDRDLLSVSLIYSADQVAFGGSMERWSADPVNFAQEVDNLRLMAVYKMERMQIGAIFELTDSNDPIYDREAIGFNGKLLLNESMDVRVQYLLADDNGGPGSTAAQQLALGIFNQMDKATQVYAAFTMTDNDSNAEYQGIDGGHGDELTTDPGGSPMAISVGAVYKF